jgi:glycerol transport system ATP-binding protein
VKIQRVDDFGNYQLISAYTGVVSVKVKVKREIAVPSEEAWLKFPSSRCCVYADEELI